MNTGKSKSLDILNLKDLQKKKCPCCYNFTLDSIGHFDICPICYWEDDNVQRDDINYRGGANEISLKEARENYKKEGVSEIKFKKYVRAPKKSEIG